MKKKTEWVLAEDNEKFGKYKLIKSKVSGEVCLVGKYGNIWEYSKTHYACVITSNRVARKYLPEENWPIQKTDETLYRFPKEQLQIWAKILGVKKNRHQMIQIIEDSRNAT